MDNYEKEHAEAIVKTLSECMVLLKKDGNFPLEKAGKIALYGNGARDTVKGGTGSGEVNSRYFITVEEGLKNAGFEITSEKWLNSYEEEKQKAHVAFVEQLKAEAKAKHQNTIMYSMGKVVAEPEYDLPLDGEGDTALYVLARNSGEGNDRSTADGDIGLTRTEVRDILAANDKYKNFMLILNVGGPVELDEVADVKNILIMSQLGAEAGTGLADVILGKGNPSGKLTTTWAKQDQYPTMEDFEDADYTRYREGIYVGYRYFDTFDKKADFPFGYGLSYSEFEIKNCETSVKKNTVTVNGEIANIGKYAGKQVLQVYVSAPNGKLDKPYQQLAGFVKTKELQPGKSETVKVSFKLEELASYDEANASYILEKGDYIVRAGSSSKDTVVCGVLRLSEDVITCKAKNVLGKTDFEDLKAPARAEEKIDESKVIEINTKDIPCQKVNYEPEYAVLDEVKTMTIEDMMLMSIGSFDPKAGLLSLLNNTSFHVPGVAGETCSRVANVPYLTMSDGPAGLRLCRQYTRDEKGWHVAGQAGIPESYLEFMPKALSAVMRLFNKPAKIKEGTVVYEQNCTAIPIGTAIAQSFNTKLAQLYGDIVGDEMERFNINLWLAPAMNIHRSIRCGRNFEYFSEDPLVSGKIAAAITDGVQKHPRCATTIKHYAANNKELHRYTNNSIVSERAMREIYLKGFGVCVKESQPKALMTSYNLLNGTHTAENRGLIEDILRCEFGYKGVVMTDWVIQLTAGKNSVYRNSLAGPTAAAGGDLFMPGCKGDYENLKKCVLDKTVSRKQLEINVSRTISLARELRK